MKIRMITADDILRVVEPVIYGQRMICLIVLLIATLFLGWQATRTRVDAGFEKSLPLEHPYMKTFKKYQEAFGGANTVLVAVIQKEGKGDIYNESFLTTLKKVTDEVFFLPGVDRARVQSLFTPNTRYIEVIEGGFAGGNVVPADYAPTPEMMALVKTNVGKANIIGRFVTNDQNGAMVASELLERDPVTNEPLNYKLVAANLENKIRGQFTAQEVYEYSLTRDVEGLKAGDVIMRDAAPPSRFLGLKTLIADQKTAGGELIRIDGSDVEVKKVANPNYNPDVSVHIIGFAKVIGDVTDAAAEVVSFFLVAFVMTGLLLWVYTGSLRLSLMPLGCALVAVVWEFGLLTVFGFGLDPFAILVPFLVLSVSVSHGTQYVNAWVGEIADNNRSAYDASLITFRRLVVAGTTALLTNVVGFATIYLIEIDIIREMSLNACFGMFAIIITNKILMPIWLTYVKIPNLEEFKRKQIKREEMGDGLWRMLAKLTDGRPAMIVLVVYSAILGWAVWKEHDLKFGDFKRGVPELRPDSRLNNDVVAINDNFAIGTDILKVIVETVPESCIRYEAMEKVDRFAWRMSNNPNVQSTVSLPQIAKSINAGWNEGSLKWRILPRNQYVIVQSIQPIDTSYGLFNAECSALPVVIFAKDHKSETIDSIIADVKQFNEENGNPEGWRPPDDPQERQAWKAPEPGTPEFEKGPYFDFALATGTIGVHAASNDVVREMEKKILIYVYLAVIVMVFLSFHSLSSVLCIMLPLAFVSIVTYAVMAMMEIGMKVATLPVAAFAAGIGVDYGIYIFHVMQEKLDAGESLKEAYYRTLHLTGKAVVFTGLTLGTSVLTWLWSGLQFQRDMGILLVFGFTANMIAAVTMLPALAHFLIKAPEHGNRELTRH